MRVISGSAKGRKLSEFSGASIRPTSDRVREAVFSSLTSRCGGFDNMKVLDLYAGTGAMAIEALSRGAAYALLVDQSAEAARLIRSNLQKTSLTDRAELISGPVADSIERVGSRGPFDLVFIDPPYADRNLDALIADVIRFGLLRSDGMMCIETSSRTHLPVKVGAVERIDRRQYGSTAINFYLLSDPGVETT